MSIAQLPREIFAEVMSFHLAAQGGDQTGNLVDKRTREANDLAMCQFWNNLKRQPPEGGINLRKLIVDIENDPANARTPCLELFKKLNRQIATHYGVQVRSPNVPILRSQFAGMQQQLLDKSLEKIWERIKWGDPAGLWGHTDLPDLASAADIRIFLNNPANAPQLNMITRLGLNSLQLHVIPSEICRLTQLQSLSIRDNPLTTIPNLSTLTQLQWLNLDNNQLTTIPDLNALIQLQNLFLSNNQLTTIPDLSTLTQLRSLDLSNNRLTTIPDLRTLTQLQWLSFTGNQLTTIPDLSTLTQLQGLNLNNNLSTTVPNSSPLAQLHQPTAASDLNMLTQLQRFEPSNNPSATVSNSSTSTHLRELTSNNTQLAESPSPVRLKGYIRYLVRGISLLFTNLSQYLIGCLRFLKRLIFRA